MFRPARGVLIAALLVGCGDDPAVARDPAPASASDAGIPVVDARAPSTDARAGLPIGSQDANTPVADAQATDSGLPVAVDASSASPGCGGVAGFPCPEGEFCSHEGGPDELGCGFADSLGVCIQKPSACTRQSQPVCGCDGASYDNPCMAHAAGVSVEAPGPCKADRDVNCDEHDVVCKKARPECPDQQVPTVVDGCWGECQAIGACVCHNADECPLRESYVCHMSAQHCGPYVN